eukprot:ANDGO_07037.mRNA.1 hypothetical protein
MSEINLIDHHIRDLNSIELDPRAKSLNLHGNHIATLKNASLDLRLPNIQHLNLSSNILVSLDFLANLSFLRVLNVASNRITSLCPIHHLQNLKIVVLSFNKIGQLSPFSSGSASVEILDLRGNVISQLSEISHLREFTQLRVLWFQVDGMHRNPVCADSQYLQTVHRCCPHVEAPCLDSGLMDEDLKRELVDDYLIEKYSNFPDAHSHLDEADDGCEDDLGDWKLDSQGMGSTGEDTMIPSPSSSIASSIPSLPVVRHLATPRIDSVLQQRKPTAAARVKEVPKGDHRTSVKETGGVTADASDNSVPVREPPRSSERPAVVAKDSPTAPEPRPREERAEVAPNRASAQSEETAATSTKKSSASPDVRLRDEHVIVEGLEREKGLRRLVEELRGQLEVSESRVHNAEFAYHKNSQRLLSQLEEARQVIAEQDARLSEEVRRRSNAENKLKEAKEFLLEREQVVQKLRAQKIEMETSVASLEDQVKSISLSSDEERKNLGHQVDSLSMDNGKLKRLVAEMNRRYEGMAQDQRRTIERLEQENKVLREDAVQYKLNLDRREEELGKSERGRLLAEEKSSNLSQENLHLHKLVVDLQGVKDANFEISKENAVCKERMANLEAELGKEHEKYALFLQDHSKLLRGVEKFRNEVHRLQSVLESKDALVKSKEDESNRLKAEVGQLKAELADVKLQVSQSVQDSTKASQDGAQECQFLKKTVAELQDCLRRVIAKHEETKKSLDDETKKNAEMEAVLKTSVQKVELAEKQRAELDALTSELKRRDMERVTSYQQLASQFDQQLSKLVIENTTLKAQSSALQMQSQDDVVQRRLLSEKDSELDRMAERLEIYEKEIKNLRRIVSDKDSKLESKRNELRDVQESLGKYNSEIEKLRKSVEAERSESADQVKVLEKKLDEQRKAEDALRRELELKISEKQGVLADRDLAIAGLRKEIEALKERMLRNDAETRVLLQAIDKQKRKLEEKEEHIQRLQNAFRSVQTEVFSPANYRRE